MKNRVFIGLGSNIEDRAYYLKSAIREIQSNPNFVIGEYSSIYETAPIGYTEQGSFLNMVLEISTNLEAGEVLSFLQQTERLYGRDREIKWGPRTLDLDILLYNQENIVADDLVIPHPRMTDRAFVIIPLFEVDEKLKIDGQTIKDIYMELTDREGVQLWKRRNGEDVFALFEN